MKVTPGTGKRGKAAKSAVHMFLQAKEATEWEKDLLKSLKVSFKCNNIRFNYFHKRIVFPNFEDFNFTYQATSGYLC